MEGNVVVYDGYALSAGGAQTILRWITVTRAGREQGRSRPACGTRSLGGWNAPAPGLYLLLIPLEVWNEDKAIRRIWVLKNNPVSFSLLVKNVIHPLEGQKERVYKSTYTDWDLPRKMAQL